MNLSVPAVADDVIAPSALIAASRLLRSATRDAHDDAEASPVMRDLFDTGIDAHRYAELLAALHGLYRHWERGHQPFIDKLATRGLWHYRSRAALLAQDRAALSIALPSRVLAMPPCYPSGDAASWGMLYVIEGSALGGRLIASRLRQCLPQQDAFGSFDIGNGESARWPRFQAALDAAISDDLDLRQAILGARAFFVAFRNALAEV